MANITETLLGRNVRVTIEGDEAVIRVKLSERLGLSASGKTTIVASTEGNKPLGDTGVILGLNAYVRRA